MELSFGIVVRSPVSPEYRGETQLSVPHMTVPLRCSTYKPGRWSCSDTTII